MGPVDSGHLRCYVIYCVIAVLNALVFVGISQALDLESPKLPSKQDNYQLDPETVTLLGLPSTMQMGIGQNFNALATLGRVLFYDRKLSGNNLVRCASCHSQSVGFDDPNRFSIGFKGKLTRRSAMGLANVLSVRSNRFFWDERASSLEEQVLEPFTDPIEMGLKAGELVTRVSEQTYYQSLIERAFGDAKVSESRIALALASFVRALVSLDSRYDRISGRHDSFREPFDGFTDPENRGKFLFFTPFERGGANCSVCHKGISLVPDIAMNNGLDAGDDEDHGLEEVSGLNEDRDKFRPPSLRNIAVRSPFMHDGRFDTLSDVIEHYSSGIQPHRNLDPVLKGADGTPLSLNLSHQDKEALVAFLQTLTDERFLTDPRFSDPFAVK